MLQASIRSTSTYESEKPSQQQNSFAAEKKAFADDGYFVIRNVISPEKLTTLHQRIVEEFDRAKQSGALFSGGGLMSGHLNCFPGEESRFIYDELRDKGIIDLIRELEPKATRMPNIGCNFNLPNSVPQHAHTDMDFTKAFMIVNVAVVDTVVENGAIELVPGSHKRFYKYWEYILKGINRNSIRVPMKRGDIMVRTSNVWHRGMPNLTTVARPMVALTWEEGGSVHDDPFSVEGGKITFRPNWFIPSRMGRLREKIFVKVPFSYSAFRFVRSLYSNKGN
jgi:hypothetical protein